MPQKDRSPRPGDRAPVDLPATTTAEPELLPPPVADEVIDEVYGAIRGMARDAALDLSIRMGALIVDRFYGGDLDAWRARSTKDASFRKLAARFDRDQDAPEGTSAAGLYRAVAVHELDQRLGVSARKHLTLTHLRAVLGLPAKRQERLLATAETRSWSTRRLEAEVAKVRAKLGGGRGRPALPMVVKTIHKLAKLVDDGSDAFAGMDGLDDLDEREAARLRETVRSMRSKCDELEAALGKRVAGSLSN